MSWLEPDCERCTALCCVALPFQAAADFAHTKPARTPCRHLSGTRCGIHAELRGRGYSGCVVFDCFGAGQVLTERGDPVDVDALMALRLRHQTAWLLQEAEGYGLPEHLRGDVGAAFAGLRDGSGEVEPAVALLRRVSSALRDGIEGPRQDLAGAVRVGDDLRSEDLRGASLRGAVLLGANLVGADLTGADLTGADLRAARLHGADLRGALFLHGSQLRAARGDSATRLPAGRSRPTHWED